VGWCVSRNVAGSLLALGLGACSVVSTERPMFGPTDARGAPVLKAGLWALPERGCRFKPRADPVKWPDCVQALEIRAGQIRDLKPDTEAQRKHQARVGGDKPMSFLLAAGDPPILQVQSSGEGAPSYFYFGLRPLASGVDGAIIRARGWIALCKDPNAPAPAPVQALPPAPSPAKPVPKGRRPGKGAKVEPPPPPPNGLLAGLTPVPGRGCTATTAASIARAVAANEAWAFTGDKDETGWTAVWVRDFEPEPKEPKTEGLVGRTLHKTVRLIRKL
jgi:hypothetical protein